MVIESEAVLNLDQDLLLEFAELATSLTGMDFVDRRQADLARAVRETIWQVKAGSGEQLLRLITGGQENHGTTVNAFISHLTIGETHFFRNQPQFAALATRILPELIERRRHEKRLRIWSAACATGEEPYSLAILLDTLLPGDDWDVSILATDIDQQALTRAAQGVYGTWSFRQTDAGIRARYFSQQGRFYTLDPTVRRRVTFAQLNLAESGYPSQASATTAMDLILCRNVMIYFTPAVTRAVADRLYAALHDGGWLLVGHAEPSQEVFAQYETINLPDAVAYRRTPALEGSHGIVPAAPRAAAAIGHRVEAPSSPDAPTAPNTRMSRPAGATPVPARGAPSDTRSAASAPDGLDAYRRARELAELGQWSEAEQWLGRAIEQSPLLGEAHYLHALLLLEAGYGDVALTAARRCTYASPSYVAGHLLLAQLYRRDGDPRRAANALNYARTLLERCAPDEAIPDTGGATARQLLTWMETDHNTPVVQQQTGKSVAMQVKAGLR